MNIKYLAISGTTTTTTNRIHLAGLQWYHRLDTSLESIVLIVLGCSESTYGFRAGGWTSENLNLNELLIAISLPVCIEHQSFSPYSQILLCFKQNRHGFYTIRKEKPTAAALINISFPIVAAALVCI